MPIPYDLDFAALRCVFPCKQVSIIGAVGGFEIPRSKQLDGSATIIANAATLVYFDLEL